MTLILPYVTKNRHGNVTEGSASLWVTVLHAAIFLEEGHECAGQWGGERGVRRTHESPIKKIALCKTLTHKDAEPFGDVSVSILRDVRNFPSAVTIFASKVPGV